MTRIVFPLFVMLATLVIYPVAQAASPAPAWRSADFLQARLVNGGKNKDGAFAAGLEIRLAEGWHAYWRTPGEGGLAPELDWSKSSNLKNVEISWPAPQRFEDFGLYSFGYEDHVLFPLAVTPVSSAEPVNMNLEAAIMVCNEICVPQNLALALVIPADRSAPAPYAAVIERAREGVPLPDGTPALKIESAVIGPDALVVRAFSQSGFKGADLFVESDNMFLTAPPEITPDKDDGRYALLRIPKPVGAGNLAEDAVSAPSTVILTLVVGDRAVEKTIAF